MADALRARSLQTGQHVLVNGAGGGAGGYDVQLAVEAGATVSAVAGARSRDRVNADGADHVVDHAGGSLRLAFAGQRLDVVLHLVRTSQEETAQLVDLVADGGVLVSTTTPGPAETDRGVRIEQVRMILTP